MSESAIDERALAETLANMKLPDATVRRQLDALPASARFGQPEQWLALVRDDHLAPWRRLAAYQLLLEHSFTYPVDRATFVREALAPLGLSDRDWIDMTIASYVPVERRNDALIRMVHLPIQTPVGPAAVYLSVNGETDTILAAAVSPDLDRAGSSS